MNCDLYSLHGTQLKFKLLIPTFNLFVLTPSTCFKNFSKLLLPSYESAMSCIFILQEAKRRGDSISVETCPHYLAFSSEEIPDGDTRFKCSPPIRDANNREKLWEAVLVCLCTTIQSVVFL